MDTADLVIRAQGQDTDAFGQLVVAFQDVAVATAYGWLGDTDLARDVAQEAFVDAYLHLADLRETTAFPAWLRTIVHKHCDRVTRSRSYKAEQSARQAANERADASNPERIANAEQQSEHLRFAVAGLPTNERQVVALHYFAQLSGPEVAQFLGLPLSTVKKRLRTARGRLRDQGERLMQKTIENIRPSNTGEFARNVSFFVALRAGDRAEVKRLLDASPDLVDAPQSWTSDLVLARVLPFSNKATPAITAIEIDDLAMLKLLLDAGANIDGACGCATAETPLWAATLLNRVDHARELLIRGANPNIRSGAGNYPLHLAAMRGRAVLVDLLLTHGADPDAKDSGSSYPPQQWSSRIDGAPTGPRTAADWARGNGFHAIAARVESSHASPPTRHQPKSARKTLPEIADGVIHTGIKAVDLFAPLPRGGLIRLPFKAGVGMIVLLGELCQRFVSRPGGVALWTGFTQPPFDLKDFEADMSEFGIGELLRHTLVSFNERAETRRAAFNAGVDEARALARDGSDVLTIVLTAAGFEPDVEANLAQLADGGITTVVMTPFPENDDAWQQLIAPYSAQINLDRRRAKRHLFPAIDPELTISNTLNEATVGARHVETALRARTLLADYARTDPLLEQIDAPDSDARAVRLLRYLCQPFCTTEPFTGQPGEQVAYADLIDSVDAILELPS